VRQEIRCAIADAREALRERGSIEPPFRFGLDGTHDPSQLFRVGDEPDFDAIS
jgi:hypothetical protein